MLSRLFFCAISVLHKTDDGDVSMAKRPTTQAYDELQRAFDHFNKHLFGGELAQCLITMQRKDVRVYGYYSPRRFGSNRQRGKTVDEIALNPIHFSHKDLGELMQTLVHEMCHMWQEHHGTPSRQGYHNREFADKMLEVGLHPSDTGKPGGKMVGQSMADYPVKGGPFEKALKRLTSRKFKVSFYDRIAELLMAIIGDRPLTLLPISLLRIAFVRINFH